MKKWTNTIAGQFIIVIVGAVFVSQFAVFTLFLLKASERIDDFEDVNVKRMISNTYLAVKSTAAPERQRILDLAYSPEVVFGLAEKPFGKTKLSAAEILNQFGNTIDDTTVYLQDIKPTVSTIWSFWFSEDFSKCFTGWEQLAKDTRCPHRTLSFQVDENQWLVAKIEPAPSALGLLTPLLFSSAITLVGITLVVFLAVKRITAPLRNLAEIASKFGRGEAIQKLDIKSPYELASTAHAFNIMQERLTQFVQDRTKMLAAVSHDLRTPITALRLRAEFVDNDETKFKMIESLDEMQNMVETCLEFAKQEIMEERIADIDLVDLLAKLSSESSKVDFTTSIPKLIYRCQAINLRRAIRNLIDNSTKYGENPELKLGRSAKKVEISLRDYGPGVPEEKLDEIFAPFVRLDTARSTKYGSVGLGLAISKTIVQKHGGTIFARNANPGLEMIVNLPVTP